MSYILEALARSDHERQQHMAPSLHTCHPPAVAETAPRGARPYIVATALLVASAAWTGWLFASKAADRKPGEQRQVQAPPDATQSRGKEAAAASPPVSGAVADAAKPQPAARETPRSVQASAPRPEPRHASTAADNVSPEPSPAGRGERVSVDELPIAVRREMPKIAISGFSHSNGAQDDRMAVINDRALHEGDEVAAGLKVESISSEGVMFNYKGYRFRAGLN